MPKHDTHDECLICFKSKQRSANLYELFFPYDPICQDCRSHFRKVRQTVNIDGLSVEYLYEYDEYMSKLLIQYKELYDEALAPVFIYPYIAYLKRKYRDYVMVMIPSRSSKREERGFDHVYLLYEALGYPITQAFVNTSTREQKRAAKKERSQIGSDIQLTGDTGLIDQKVLLIDDIVTTGSTMLACHNLLSKRAKEIRGLAIAGNRRLADSHIRKEKISARKSKVV